MKNFAIIKDGKEYWVSRSVAVAVSLYTYIGTKLCVLANKRGKGLPNHVGQWNVVSGYLDYDETLREACNREVFEETGLDISNIELYQKDIEDSPNKENQVILFRYMGFVPNGPEVEFTNEHADKDEVEEIKWVPLEDVYDYEWTSELHRTKILVYGDMIVNTDPMALAMTRIVRAATNENGSISHLPVLDTKMPFAMFDIETGEGWKPIAMKVLRAISSYNENAAEGSNIFVDQVKEKFSELRIYVTYDNVLEPFRTLIDSIIDEAAEEASRTCEICGTKENVGLRVKGWYSVMCEDCARAIVKGRSVYKDGIVWRKDGKNYLITEDGTKEI